MRTLFFPKEREYDFGHYYFQSFGPEDFFTFSSFFPVQEILAQYFPSFVVLEN